MKAGGRRSCTKELRRRSVGRWMRLLGRGGDPPRPSPDGGDPPTPSPPGGDPPSQSPRCPALRPWPFARLRLRRTRCDNTIPTQNLLTCNTVTLQQPVASILQQYVSLQKQDVNCQYVFLQRQDVNCPPERDRHSAPPARGPTN